MPERILPARPGPGSGRVFAKSWMRRMTGSAAALVSFEESSGLLHELAGVEVSAKQVERVAEGLGAEIAVDERQPVETGAPPLPLWIWGWRVPGCRCAPRKWPIAPASKQMVLPKPGRPRWSPSGRRNHAISKVSPPAI